AKAVFGVIGGHACAHGFDVVVQPAGGVAGFFDPDVGQVAAEEIACAQGAFVFDVDVFDAIKEVAGKFGSLVAKGRAVGCNLVFVGGFGGDVAGPVFLGKEEIFVFEEFFGVEL